MSLAQGNNTPTWPSIEPGSPDPESDALTTRPVRSQNEKKKKKWGGGGVGFRGQGGCERRIEVFVKIQKQIGGGVRGGGVGFGGEGSGWGGGGGSG